VRLVSLVRQRPDLMLVPPAALKLNLDGIRDSGSGIRRESGRATQSRGPNPRSGAHRPSWWTARALEGAVTPGFTKEEILRPAKENPRAPGGVFERVGALLSDLLDQG
jgi:hypothetical protein